MKGYHLRRRLLQFLVDARSALSGMLALALLPLAAGAVTGPAGGPPERDLNARSLRASEARMASITVRSARSRNERTLSPRAMRSVLSPSRASRPSRPSRPGQRRAFSTSRPRCRPSTNSAGRAARRLRMRRDRLRCALAALRTALGALRVEDRQHLTPSLQAIPGRTRR